MRKKLLAIVLIFALSACDNPSYSFVDPENKVMKSSDWKNKWIIINYWAEWCEPCAQEVNQLNQFYHQKAENVVVVGVNYNQLSLPDLKAAVKKMHIEFPVLQQDPRKVFHLPNIEVIPTTFIINPQGKVVRQLQGPQTAAVLKEVIR